jgi:hypothetical protein
LLGGSALLLDTLQLELLVTLSSAPDSQRIFYLAHASAGGDKLSAFAQLIVDDRQPRVACGHLFINLLKRV